LQNYFLALKRLKSNPLARAVSHGPIRPHPAARYFQTSFRRSRLAGVSLLAEDRPFARSRLSADSFSPQGVRSVGSQLFENLIFARPPGTPFASLGPPILFRRVGPAGCAARQNDPLASYFQTCPMAFWVRALESAFGFVFTKPSATARLGSLRSAAKRPIGFVFSNPPMASWPERSTRRLGLFLQAADILPKRKGCGCAPLNDSPRLWAASLTPRPSCASSPSWVRCAAQQQAIGFVFSNFPTASASDTQRAAGFVFTGRQRPGELASQNLASCLPALG